MATVVITGATAGIGRGFAEEFASKGLDLVLVARDAGRLEDVGRELAERYGISCEILPADLAVRSDVDRVAARLADPVRPVWGLVNNAGFGLGADFPRASVDDEQRTIDVMITAVMRLAHAAIPGMVARGGGVVINVSSMASWLALGTYSAAKAWVTVFSEGLAIGLAGTGVRVTAVCPGYVHTEFHQRAGIDMAEVPDWMWLDVPQVVSQAIRDVARGRSVSVAGAQYRPLSRVLRHGPRSISRLAAGVRESTSGFGRRR